MNHATRKPSVPWPLCPECGSHRMTPGFKRCRWCKAADAARQAAKAKRESLKT